MAQGVLESITTFSALLRHLRLRARLTQDEFGLAVGYSRAHVARLESGQRLPDLAMVQAVLVPALHLESQPELASRLIELAGSARGETPHLEPQPSRPTAGLPSPLTHFVGRERELAEVKGLLAPGGTRLLTLTGSGGCGKTRLAQHVAADLLSSYANGGRYIELAALNDPALLAGAVASAFGLQVNGDSAFEQLADLLAGRHLLLVLDNCEHLIDAVATFTVGLLRACPRVSILATSREGLNVEGESALRVPPMQPAEAAQLFVERARAARPDLTMDVQDAVVSHVCQRLDGMPLAIELAAARLHGMSLNELATRLDDRFALLAGSRRGVLPRQQTLRATIDWSYELLSEAERVLFRRLSIFAGGWTAELAEVVAADAPPSLPGKGAGGLGRRDILPLLLQLVEKSLVVADAEPRGGAVPGGATRYRMLETVRQYAAEKLRVSELGDTDHRYERLAEYVVSTLTPDTRQSRLISTEEMVARMGPLEAELNNLRALMAWAGTRADGGTASLRIAAALAVYWGVAQGHMTETQTWLEEALARSHAAPGALRLKALNGLLRTVAYRGSNPVRCAALAEEALALSAEAEIDDPYERIESLFYAFWVQCALCMKLELWTPPASRDVNPHLLRMESLAAELLALAQRLAYPHGTAVGLEFSGDVRSLRGDHTTALRYYADGLRLARETGNAVMSFGLIEDISSLDSARALAESEQEVSRQRALGEREGLAVALRGLSQLVAGGGDFERARDLLQESLALRRKLNVPWSLDGGIGGLHYDLGRVAFLAGNYPEALGQLQRALDLYQQAGELLTTANIHLYIGLSHLGLGDAARATDPLRWALGLFRDLDAAYYIPCGLAALALLAQARDQLAHASRLAGAAALLYDRSQNWPWFWATAWRLWATDRRVHERLVTAISGLRDDPATAGAWMEGQQMSPDEAVAYALAIAAGSA